MSRRAKSRRVCKPPEVKEFVPVTTSEGRDAEGYSPCMQTHLLLQHGEIRYESQDFAVHYGPQ